jgi:hypothetical protein
VFFSRLKFTVVVFGISLYAESQTIFSIDSTFGVDGSLDLDYSNYEYAGSCGLSSNGIFISGNIIDLSNGLNHNAYIAQLSQTGVSNHHFEFDAPFGTETELRGTYHRDSFLYVLGNSKPEYGVDTSSVFVARFFEDGSIDSTFNGGAYFQLQVAGAINRSTQLIFDNDQIVLTGYTFDSNYVHKELGFVARYNFDGTPDTTFGGTGVLSWDKINGLVSRHDLGASFYSVCINPWGGYSLMGYLDDGSNTKALIVDITRDGNINFQFNGTGYRYFDAVPTLNSYVAKGLGFNNELCIAIDVNGQDDLLFAMIDSAGNMTESSWVDYNNQIDNFKDMVQVNDRLLVGFESKNDSSLSNTYNSNNFYLAFLDVNLDIDNSIGISGFMVFDLHDDAGEEYITNIAVNDSAIFLFGEYENPGMGNLRDLSLVKVKYEQILTLNEQSMEKLGAYPNPVSDILSFNQIFDSVRVYDVSGRLIFSENMENSSIDLSAVPNGTYIVRVNDGDNSYAQKIIVSH